LCCADVHGPSLPACARDPSAVAAAVGFAERVVVLVQQSDRLDELAAENRVFKVSLRANP
jgi:hypothetical protein